MKTQLIIVLALAAVALAQQDVGQQDGVKAHQKRQTVVYPVPPIVTRTTTHYRHNVPYYTRTYRRYYNPYPVVNYPYGVPARVAYPGLPLAVAPYQVPFQAPLLL